MRLASSTSCSPASTCGSPPRTRSRSSTSPEHGSAGDGIEPASVHADRVPLCALTGAIALKLGTPAVLVRRVPKTYFVSYGDDPAIGDGRLAGERLPPGTPLHLIDDLVFSGQTLRSAREALKRVGPDSRTASAILWTYRADAAKEELAAAGITEITCLIHQNLIPG